MLERQGERGEARVVGYHLGDVAVQDHAGRQEAGRAADDGGRGYDEPAAESRINPTILVVAFEQREGKDVTHPYGNP